MHVLKQIIGIVLVMIAALLSFAVVISSVKTINQCIIEVRNSASFGTAYVIGNILGLVLMGIVIYFIGKLGFKLISGKNKMDAKQ
jgi:hypothetical protein